MNTNNKRRCWRRVTWYAFASCLCYLLTVGPVSRCSPEFADWFYAPLSPVADIPVAGDALRRWIAFWGVEVD